MLSIYTMGLKRFCYIYGIKCGASKLKLKLKKKNKNNRVMGFLKVLTRMKKQLR
jgi:hypothetical protein